MKWLAWENVGVDRMACAWLIRRFIDPQAEFQFIPAGQKPLQEVALEPVAPGLDLLCRGLRRISHDDDEAIERGCLVYDALYVELTNTDV